MKTLAFLFLFVSTISSLTAFCQEESKTALKISGVVVDITNGDPVVYYKNFKQNTIQRPFIFYMRNFRNSSGIYPERLQKTIEKELVHKNYPVLGWGNLFDELKVNVKPKYAIGAIVEDLSIYVSAYFHKAEVKNSIRWKLLDLESNEIVFNERIEADFYTNYNRTLPTSTGNYSQDFSVAIDSSIYASIGKLLTNPNVLELLASKGGKSATLSDSSLISIPSVAVQDSPGAIERTRNGTVTVKTALGHGSGFYINTNGLILTCYHVIQNSKTVEVMLNQGVTIEAEVLKTNPDFDLALLKIPNVSTGPLPLGNSAQSKIANEVFIVGTPGSSELYQSVSKGILSGKRSINGKNYLQTDASVSPGNSGGPITTTSGEVIGIVNAKIVSKGTEGIGFAIPIEVALTNLAIQVR